MGVDAERLSFQGLLFEPRVELLDLYFKGGTWLTPRFYLLFVNLNN